TIRLDRRQMAQPLRQRRVNAPRPLERSRRVGYADLEQALPLDRPAGRALTEPAQVEGFPTCPVVRREDRDRSAHELEELAVEDIGRADHAVAEAKRGAGKLDRHERLVAP